MISAEISLIRYTEETEISLSVTQKEFHLHQ
jgi:hypothetical protein